MKFLGPDELLFKETSRQREWYHRRRDHGPDDGDPGSSIEDCFTTGRNKVARGRRVYQTPESELCTVAASSIDCRHIVRGPSLAVRLRRCSQCEFGRSVSPSASSWGTRSVRAESGKPSPARPGRSLHRARADGLERKAVVPGASASLSGPSLMAARTAMTSDQAAHLPVCCGADRRTNTVTFEFAPAPPRRR